MPTTSIQVVKDSEASDDDAEDLGATSYQVHKSCLFTVAILLAQAYFIF